MGKKKTEKEGEGEREECLSECICHWYANLQFIQKSSVCTSMKNDDGINGK